MSPLAEMDWKLGPRLCFCALEGSREGDAGGPRLPCTQLGGPRRQH